MTVRERLHWLVECLPETDMAQALEYLDRLVATAPGDIAMTADSVGGVEVANREEFLRLARPLEDDDPLWKLVGIVGDEYDGPTDIARNHDTYLAEADADRHEEDERAADEAAAFTLDDPLWRIVGIGSTSEPTDVATYKDEYLADACDIHRP